MVPIPRGDFVIVPEITQAKVPEGTQAASNTAKRLTGGQLVARALKAEGIKAIFTLSGGHVMDIYNGCVDEGIAIIGVRHEQAAAHAADAWTRLTGIPGCAVVTAERERT
jgi:acetolactate synthase I/II/III large subunit